MRARPYRFRLCLKLFLAVASGILQILLFPKFSLSWVSWVALVPLLIVLFRETAWQRAALLGWIFGLTFFSGCCYWILAVLQGYSDMHWSGAVFLFALLIVYLALFPGLFAWGFARLSLRLPGSCFLLAPFLWVSTEYLRGYLLTGFPWCLTGYALADEVHLAQIATVTGVYGLSFLVVLINTLIAGCFFRSRLAIGGLPVALAMVAGLVWVGMRPAEAGNTREAHARLVQTHIALDQPWDRQSQTQIVEELVELSQSPPVEDSETIPDAGPMAPAPHQVRLVIWPETPAPFYYHDDPSFRKRMNGLAAASGSTLLFGFVDWPMGATGSNTGPYNSAGTVSPKGELIAQYDKMHLVPFGEYVPWSWLFFFVEKISTGVGGYQPGSRVVVSRLESGEKVGVFICYEAVVPDLVRRFVADGAEVLVNITNDTWFGNSAAPHQHLLMARMRAVENRRYLLRAANSGISAVIDPFGRVLAGTELHRRTVLDSPFRFRQSLTFYSLYGDIFAYLCLGLSLVLVLAGFRSGSFPAKWLRRTESRDQNALVFPPPPQGHLTLKNGNFPGGLAFSCWVWYCSGMEKSDFILPPSVKDVTLRLARPDERRRWDATMAQRHYLGFQQFAGRGLRYVAEYQKCWLALIGWQSGAFKCRPRDRWIGWRPQEQFPRLRLIANNTRLLVLTRPGAIPNLATSVMAANLRRLSADWQATFGHPLELAEAFVDPKRFAGTLYAAGNWRSVGRTRGFSRSNGRYTEPHGHLKKMYVYPLRRGARKRLRARQPCLCWEPQRPDPVSPEAVPLPSLLQEFASIPDHRRPQGRKFQLPTLLAIWELARLSGYRGVDATWRYACALNQEELRTLGAWRHPGTGRYHPPSRATLHRALIETAPEALQAAVNRWAARRQPSNTALATDGKRLRGANRQGEAHYQTVSLVNHANAMPIATRAYTEQGGEIAAVLALLEEVDVRGSVITLDALHTTRNTALAIRHRHRAHYLFTVKGNAPETFQTLETIDWDRDASSHFCENDEKAHGRIQQRRIQVLKPLRGLINYPSVRQMFRITRKRHRVKTGEASIEVTYGLTSLPPQQVDAERLLALNRGHWVIENRNHRPRDTTFGEDASLMHTGHGPSNNAIVNHTALAIIFHRGFRQVQAAVQHFAMDRAEAIRAVAEPG